MVDMSLFEDREIEFLTELVFHKVDFMIVGLSAAALQGAPVVTQDIDLWFKDLSDIRIQKALEKVGGTYIPPIHQNPPLLGGPSMGLFDVVMHMHGLGDFENEKENIVCIRVGGAKLPVLKLERIIKSKKAADRLKDKLVLEVLEDTLRGIRDYERKRN
ncbi:MAG: hypothetical protein H6751_13340 [Candidatus Omnitrophica bacterium]|nr:hypothetical protein [Candidatus Omnitrophota bacterium]